MIKIFVFKGSVPAWNVNFLV